MPSRKEIDPRIATLARVDRDLKKVGSPKSNYAMSPQMIARRIAEKDQLSQELGLSENETTRARQIGGYKGYLTRIGYPLWRINGAEAAYARNFKSE